MTARRAYIDPISCDLIIQEPSKVRIQCLVEIDPGPVGPPPVQSFFGPFILFQGRISTYSEKGIYLMSVADPAGTLTLLANNSLRAMDIGGTDEGARAEVFSGKIYYTCTDVDGTGEGELRSQDILLNFKDERIILISGSSVASTTHTSVDKIGTVILQIGLQIYKIVLDPFSVTLAVAFAATSDKAVAQDAANFYRVDVNLKKTSFAGVDGPTYANANWQPIRYQGIRDGSTTDVARWVYLRSQRTATTADAILRLNTSLTSESFLLTKLKHGGSAPGFGYAFDETDRRHYIATDDSLGVNGIFSRNEVFSDATTDVLLESEVTGFIQYMHVFHSDINPFPLASQVSKVFICEATKIWTCDAGGYNLATIVTATTSGFRAMAFDNVSNHIYVVDATNNRITRYNENGGGRVTWKSGLNNPLGLSLFSSEIYFSERTGQTVKKDAIALGAETTLVSGFAACHISIDEDERELYIADNTNGQIKKMSLTPGTPSVVAAWTSAYAVGVDSNGAGQGAPKYFFYAPESGTDLRKRRKNLSLDASTVVDGALITNAEQITDEVGGLYIYTAAASPTCRIRKHIDNVASEGLMNGFGVTQLIDQSAVSWRGIAIKRT